MHYLVLTIVGLIQLYLLKQPVFAHLEPQHYLAQANVKDDLVVRETAKKISVRIVTNSGTGSGVIIKKQGSKYRVLTNYHVIADNLKNNSKILTADGKIYLGKNLTKAPYKNLDVALVEFTAGQTYQVATIANSSKSILGNIVYASGFPAWNFTKKGEVTTSAQETSNLGFKAFKITTGTIEIILKKILLGGYQIGYTNQVTIGMSGGALLNQKGELIGINGKLKSPLQGIHAFTFSNGQIPSEAEFKKMDALSWAISVDKFKKIIN